MNTHTHGPWLVVWAHRSFSLSLSRTHTLILSFPRANEDECPVARQRKVEEGERGRKERKEGREGERRRDGQMTEPGTRTGDARSASSGSSSE